MRSRTLPLNSDRRSGEPSSHRHRLIREADRDLEDISHIINHDLRAPLRHIEGFSNLLTRHLDARPGALDDKGRHYLKRITDGSEAMLSLLDDLLTYSRMSRQEMHCVTVDLDRMLASLARGLNLPCELGHLGRVKGDPSLLRLAFECLLNNAVKFSAGSTAPRIWLRRSGTKEGRAVLEVGDQGVGYDPAFADKLFAIFQRLHPREDFAGNGIGLAIVARVVQRHGGRVWAESQVGEGARFFLTLEATEEPS